jgi:anti-sigma regulatory factor (Ser/Thr protein kinase)
MNELTLATSISGFDEIRDEVETFCETHELPVKTGFSLQLVLEELVVNIVNHGYGGAAGPVRLQLGADRGRVTGEIVDEGVPFDPTEAPAAETDADVDERAIGGLGIHLVRSMVEDLAYERVGGRNVVRFTLPIPEDETAGEPD